MSPRFPRASDNHPGQRAGDVGGADPSFLGFVRRRVPWATVWSFLASAIAVLALGLGADNQGQIQAGRRDVTKIICAVASGVSQAGHNVIANAQPEPPKFEAFLVAHGFPPYRVRKREAKKAARAYVVSISSRVDKQVGRKGDGLIRSDGTLDCKRLETLARTNNP